MLEAYASMGHEVDVIHYRFPGEAPLPDALAALVRRYIEVQLDVHRIRRHSGLLPPLALECVNAHGKRAPSLDAYDVVQAETSSSWVIAREVPAPNRVLVLHDDDDARLRALAAITGRPALRLSMIVTAVKYRRLQRLAMLEVDRVWFASGRERDRLLGRMPRGQTRVVPNGALDELWSIPPLEEDGAREVLLVAPGFYAANTHGLDWFIENVWPLVVRRVPDAHLRVVGVGWNPVGSFACVDFVGWRESLTDEYARSRVVIAPVFAGGGTNLKVLEGMASGRPVVTTPLGADGISSSSGVVATDEPASFGTEVAHYLLDIDSAREAGTSNRRAVDRLRWSLIWREAESNLRDLVAVHH
jgi:glycosyltransferase involved in cell wall biosynthesis